MIDYQAFGRKIRQLRRMERMTQEDLAQKIGVSVSFIGHIERGSRTTSLETLVLICNTLKTTPTYLLEENLVTTVDEHVHVGLSVEQRKKLKEFLRMAQVAIDDCVE